MMCLTLCSSAGSSGSEGQIDIHCALDDMRKPKRDLEWMVPTSYRSYPYFLVSPKSAT